MRQSDEERREGPHIGIYGWRKRCLYLLILTLLVLVVVNLTLTLWVLRVMEFNTEGMGDVRVVEGGLEVRGDAYMMGRLVASSIRSRRGQGITLTSSHNFTIRASDNTLVLGNERLECTGSKFRVSDLQGRTLFSADKNQVIVGADMLKVSGVGGVVFDGSVQTPLVRASPGADLSLESPTRTLQILGPNGVTIESRAGDIKATSLSDLTLKSLDGGIKLEAEKVMIPGLQTGQFKTGQAMVRNPSDVYQLCACQNGRLFLAPSNGHCATDSENLNVCR